MIYFNEETFIVLTEVLFMFSQQQDAKWPVRSGWAFHFFQVFLSIHDGMGL